jgi:hypothetical protein
MRAAAEHAQEQGADHLELDVLENNEYARRFYDRLGFATVERRLAAPVDGLLADPTEGATFGFVHVQTDDVEKVRRDAVKVLRSDATDEDPEKLKSLAKELSYTTGGVVLSLGIQLGAVVRYDLFDRGADVDEYLSVPEYYGPLPPGDAYALGANATVIARLTGADPKRVREVARTAVSPGELPPAQELYDQLAAVMGLEP